jgi:PhzF family phenazine biosynthesis protein
MQAVATEVGFAETAFVTHPVRGRSGDEGSRHVPLRFFSPIAEVPFCGHATIATAVALAERHGVGEFVFETAIGPVAIETREHDGRILAAFTSVEPRLEEFEPAVLELLLALLGTTRDGLDPRFPPRISFAGNRHPVLVFADRDDFDAFCFDPAAVRELMDREGWAGTVTTLFPVSEHEFDARNLFPVGTLTEDPATGSAAAAVGGYLRGLDLVEPPCRVTITQGRHIGRPSVLTVDIPLAGGITVVGSAYEMRDDEA